MTTSPITITAELLDDLQRKAKDMRGWPNDRAFAGDDHWCVGTVDEEDNEYPVIEVHPEYYDQEHHGEQMARYYAAANPATILALVEHIRSLTERLERAENELKRWEPIHYEVERRAGKTFEWDGCDFQVTIFAGDYAAIAQEGAEHE